MARTFLVAALFCLPAIAQNREGPQLRALRPVARALPLPAIELDLTALAGGVPRPVASLVRVVRCRVTAYTDHDPADIAAGYGRGVTATGARTADQPYGVAADPRALPFGTRVRIPGYGNGQWRTVDDTGGRMRRSWREEGVIHLDVRFKSRRSALAWGDQWVDVEIAP